MSEGYVVSFFADDCSDFDEEVELTDRIMKIIDELAEKHKEVVFLVPFGDEYSASINLLVSGAACEHPDTKLECKLVYSCSVNGLCELVFDDRYIRYDGYVYFKDGEDIPMRQGRIERNRKMVDKSDLSFFYIKKRGGRIYNTMRYAEENGKEYILLK